ncbi:helix-turn-helix transcriptional regulator [Stenotrophomonas nematodicola]|uniref:helix-turn-helix transcriptional regulator n=1 Tax=Stenotrophomonas nematodicola TaxID=2656746 RepID=UPI0012916A09|nr:AlpA family phage regulatory protein [Stenotrophomonas nematodicola]
MSYEARLLTLTDVKSRVGISGATIYRKMADGTFPKPAKVGARSLWPSPKIDEWIASVLDSQNMGQNMGRDSQAKKKPL